MHSPARKPVVHAFAWVPPFAQGFVRDLRVRWALEEAGVAYDERLLAMGEHKQPAYRALQPFGQVPAYERDDGCALFESGAIVLDIAERSPALLPPADPDRARAKSWMFAALSSVEPPILALQAFDGQPGDARDKVAGLVDDRLRSLAAALGDREFLVGAFSAADLLMATVLREAAESVGSHPSLVAYRERCVARPAFQRALAAQLAPFARNAPKTAAP